MMSEKKSYCYYLTQGLMPLEIEANSIQHAKKIIKHKHDIKRIPKSFKIWEKML